MRRQAVSEPVGGEAVSIAVQVTVQRAGYVRRPNHRLDYWHGYGLRHWDGYGLGDGYGVRVGDWDADLEMVDTYC